MGAPAASSDRPRSESNRPLSSPQLLQAEYSILQVPPVLRSRAAGAVLACIVERDPCRRDHSYAVLRVTRMARQRGSAEPIVRLLKVHRPAALSRLGNALALARSSDGALLTANSLKGL
jgi:hypothetical protein